MTRHMLLLPAALLIACGPSEKPSLSTVVVGHCAYQGPNSRLPECKDYLGEWTDARATTDCKDLKGTYEGGTVCAPEAFLGACLFGNKPDQNRTYIVSENTDKCGSARTGCEFFGGGYWEASPVCGGVNDELVVTSNFFVEPRRVCFMPGPGERAGTSDGGMVCVWESIHGATEEGRSFREDAVCDNSRGGRPYYAKEPDPRYTQADPRRSDPAYLAEEAWVKQQINATSCVCCHSDASPNGEAAIFNIDRAGSLANQFSDRGIAHGSGLVNSIPLGAFRPEVNNGFSKSDHVNPDDSIFLTTDRARMKRFWEKEAEYRGLTAASFVGVPDGFGPLSEQLYYRPSACTGGEGIAADGTITWGKGRARYVYVMEATASSPTIYPNLDLPLGTLWRIDVTAEGAPVASGTVKYGAVPEGLRQRFPLGNVAPPALEAGKQYYLYVTADQVLPITRCLVTAR